MCGGLCVEKILVFGAGGHAKLVIDAIEKEGKYEIVGLIDDGKRRDDIIFGYPIIGCRNDFKRISLYCNSGIVAVGDNWTRGQIVSYIIDISKTFNFVTVIHPFSSIGRGVSLGKGSVVLPGAVINSDTHIGMHCVIHTKSSVDHDCRLSDYITIGPGATVAGNVTIGEYTAIAIGAQLIHSINIGVHSVIGAGATAVHDIGSFEIAYGTPATRVRSRNKGERYL